MANQLPNHIYRYVRLHDEWGEGLRARLQDVVQNAMLWFSEYTKLNDPFDGSVHVEFDEDEAVVRKYWEDWVPAGPNREEIINDAIRRVKDPEMQEQLRRSVEKTCAENGVCCFTEMPDDLLMWSYYASGHTGLCLRFQSEALGPVWHNNRGVLIQVTYHTVHPTIPYFSAPLTDFVYGLVGAKAAQWQHEREWRLARTRQLGRVPFPAHALDGIILGCKVTAEDERFVLDLVKERKPPIQILRATKVDRAYSLRIAEMGSGHVPQQTPSLIPRAKQDADSQA
jgi:hypothetical protein